MVLARVSVLNPFYLNSLATDKAGKLHRSLRFNLLSYKRRIILTDLNQISVVFTLFFLIRMQYEPTRN